ncbi:hypothetical protein P344_03040 [Spiroplasma mirum ATCC 29335]|uniref:Uncharacterized protein n=1 Tax=Spiroplasma mirum ATCC 29335 TaxID=838561 RepID=W0GQN6_9MOLU|nr:MULTISPECIES: hypothetical protein [Spiroplasma]AHF60944.1 hypothetical protein SMM_0517 [Spiroplasma mirum ATCC 29335]AHI57952.1 hypothetical protein P344_03040 [Spiroplasma mirum ATCC 29335]AKM53049.1 hypothetical protein SATRI_v1c05700 [Spiroplasma atrichopogonis]
MANPPMTPLTTFLQLKYKFDIYAKLINNFTNREGKDYKNNMPEAWVQWKKKMAATLGVENSDKTNNWKNDFQKEFYQKIIAIKNKYNSQVQLQKYRKVCNLKLTQNLEAFLDNYFEVYDDLSITIKMYKNNSDLNFSNAVETNWRKIKIYQDTYQINIKNKIKKNFIKNFLINFTN